MGCCEADPGDGAGSGVRGCVLKKYDIFGRELYCKRLFLRMFHANTRFFHSNGGLFHTIVKGFTLFLYLIHDYSRFVLFSCLSVYKFKHPVPWIGQIRMNTQG